MSQISLNAKDMKLSNLVFIMLGMMCAGSFGIESMIGASGPGMGFLGLILVPIFWAIPIALVSAELGAAYPEEGGCYVWARNAMGPFAGFVVGAGRAFYFWLAAGAVLALSKQYIQTYLGLSDAVSMVVMAVVLAASAIIVIVGLDVVSITSKIFIILISVPFGLLAILSLFKLEYNPVDPFMNPANDLGTNLGYVFALGIWMFGGWQNAASLAGEIRNFSKIFPKALMIVLICMMVIYITPNMLGLAAAGNWEKWGTEWDVVVVAEIVGGKFLGTLMLIAAVFSNIILFIGGLTHNSRQPMVLAEDNIFPKVFTKLHKKYNTPYVGVIVMCVIGFAGCYFDFNVIITFLVFLTFMLEMMGFLSAFILRIKDPDRERPFKVPGGKIGIVILFIPIVAISAYSIIGSGMVALIGFIGFAIIIPILYLIFKKMYGGLDANKQ